MKKIALLLTTLSISITLTGCTNTAAECDPSVELNVFSKAACKLSGSYDERIDQKEKLVLDAKAENAKFQQVYQSIKAQQSSVNQSIAQKKAQQAKLNREINALTGNLKQKAQGKKSLLKEIADVENQLKSVNSSTSSEMEKQVELEKLQGKLSRLQKALGL